MSEPTPPPPRRFRFGLRTLFVLVTVTAMTVYAGRLIKRSFDFARRAQTHANTEHVNASVDPADRQGQSIIAQRLAVYHAYHRQMRDKYEWAARYPWLPVEPDPPEPPLFEHLPPIERAVEERTAPGN